MLTTKQPAERFHFRVTLLWKQNFFQTECFICVEMKAGTIVPWTYHYLLLSVYIVKHSFLHCGVSLSTHNEKTLMCWWFSSCLNYLNPFRATASGRAQALLWELQLTLHNYSAAITTIEKCVTWHTIKLRRRMLHVAGGSSFVRCRQIAPLGFLLSGYVENVDNFLKAKCGLKLIAISSVMFRFKLITSFMFRMRFSTLRYLAF